MYLNGTKCQLFILSCFMSVSLFAKNVPTTPAENGRKPICFIENKGQVCDETKHKRNDIQFKLSTPGMDLYVGNASLHYQFRDIKLAGKKPQVKAYQMIVSLLGADQQAKVTTEQPQPYYESYFLTQMGNNGLTAHAYNKITYHNVYPEIDWVLYVNGDNVEYDFVVRPGGNPADIKIKYDHANSIALTADGSINAQTPMGQVTEKHPVAFETASGTPVQSKFIVHDNIISFETGKYNGTLTIDPYLRWTTYVGGSNEDRVTSVKGGPGGEAFACGYTASTDLPVTGGVLQGSNASTGSSTYDAFFAGYSSTGTRLFTTYFGGTGDDMAMGIAYSTGATRIYIIGNTTSSGLGSGGGAYRSTNSGNTDMFLIRFNNSGTTRTFCTYIGGTGTESGNDVTTDATGNIYVAGSTTSTTASTIVSGTPYQATFGGGSKDGYLGKFASNGSIIWATYYGGGGDDEINAVAVDSNTLASTPLGKGIYTTGTTTSVSGIATSTGNQTGFGGGTSTTDAFLASFTETGGTTSLLNWATYIGASGSEQGMSIACDPLSREIFVAGNTASTDSIAHGLSYQSTYGGSTQDAFLQKYTATGALVWGTYLGGSGVDFAQGVAVDAARNIVMAGSTFSTSGIANGIPFQSTAGGSGDAFIAKFNLYGQNIYSGYYGNTGLDYANAITTDPTNTGIIIGGFTNSTSGFATTGAAQSTIGGGSTTTFHDGFVSRFTQDTLVRIVQRFKDTIVCQGGTLTVYDSTLFRFEAGNIFTVQLSDASGSFAAPVNIGSVTATSTGSITCVIPSSTPLGTGYRIRIAATAPNYVSPDNIWNIEVLSSLPTPTVSASTPVCVGDAISLFASASYEILSYTWQGPAASGFSSSAQNPIIPGASVTTAYSGTYTVTTTHNGCPAVNTTVNVTVNSVHPAAPAVTANSPLCAGDTLRLTATPVAAGTYSFSWSGPAGFSSALQNPRIAGTTLASAGTYYVSDTLGGCGSPLAAVTVVIRPNIIPTITISVTPNDTICLGTTAHFISSYTNAGYVPTFQWYSRASTPVTGATLDYWNTNTWPGGTDIFCTMVSSADCPITPFATSNVIHMDVIDHTPIIRLTCTPDSFISRGASVTFNTTVAGSLLNTRTWYINNVPLIDTYATGTLTLNHITNNDTVRYEVTSNALCANIGASNFIIIRVNTAVGSLLPSLSAIDLFPNPNTGSFTIKGELENIADGNLNVQVSNALGQTMYTGVANIKNSQINQTISLDQLTPGIYQLKLSTEGESKVFRFVKE